MKIAVVSGLRRREGDLGEFFLLRAIHEAAYLDADTFIVTDGLCASPSEKLDFIDILNASIKLNDTIEPNFIGESVCSMKALAERTLAVHRKIRECAK